MVVGCCLSFVSNWLLVVDSSFVVRSPLRELCWLRFSGLPLLLGVGCSWTVVGC